MKHNEQVPGLYRGIRVWQLLCRSGELSLEQISAETSYPKASVLRMLQTLGELELIERDERTRNYKACATIVRSRIKQADFRTRVQQALESLSSELGVTAEWYEPDEKGMKIIQRSSPLEAEVYVAARAGFIRHWNGELDSVAALAYGLDADAPYGRQRTDLWIYGPAGERVSLDAERADELIRTARECGYMTDINYNNRGIKRMSRILRSDDGFAGILSLALVFTPALELSLDKYKAGLDGALSSLAEKTGGSI